MKVIVAYLLHKQSFSGSETRYPNMEKFALAPTTALRKLRPNFQAYTIEVLTNFPLKQVLQKTDTSEILLKWAIKLSEFDIIFKARTTVNGQALVDFVAEFTHFPENGSRDGTYRSLNIEFVC